MLNLDGQMPLDVKPEETVLNSAMLSPEYIGTVMLSPEDFAKTEHRQLWQILQDFHESGASIDPMIVRGECKRRGLDAVALLILHLVSFTPDVPRFKHYARRVLDVSQRRQMISAAERLVGLATDRSVSIHDSASKAADFISEIAARGLADRERTAAELFKESLRELDAGKARKRIRVGMPFLPHGLPRGVMTALAGMTERWRASICLFSDGFCGKFC